MYMTHVCYTENTKVYDLAIRKPRDMVFTYFGELVSCENLTIISETNIGGMQGVFSWSVIGSKLSPWNVIAVI